MLKRTGLIIAVVMLVGAIATILPVQAHEGEDHSHEGEATAQTTDENKTEEQAPASYDYVAQAGDSYHVLARKAVQTYGIENSVNLSGAEIIAAETHLAQAAEVQGLNEGQSVSISKDDVKSAVEQAQNLSDEEEAAWDYYVQFVDFDTSNNGE